MLRLLRACLHPASALDAAELAWCIGRGSLPDGRGLLPLLAVTAAAGGDSRAATSLRAARLYERQRSGRFDALAEEAVAQIAARGGDVMLSRGVLLAATAYPAREARHCHDLDLVVNARDAAIAGLAAAGFALAGMDFVHRSGMTIRLHATPLPPGDPASARIRGVPGTGGAMAARHIAPSPSDVLLHVLLLASYRCTGRPFWIADAWFAITRTSIEWGRIAGCRGVDALFLLRALMLLRVAFAAPIPSQVMAELRQAVNAMTLRQQWQSLHRAAGWRGRRALARHLATPQT